MKKVLWLILGCCISLYSFSAFAQISREPPFTVEVHVRQNLPEKFSFVIVPMRFQEGNRRFDELSRMLADELIKQGHTQAQQAKEADAVVFLRYFISNTRDFVFTAPTFTRRVEINIFDRRNFEKRNLVELYHAISLSEGNNNNPAFAAPFHLKAIFFDFPGADSSERVFIVRGLNDGQVERSPERRAVRSNIEFSFDFLNSGFPFDN